MNKLFIIVVVIIVLLFCYIACNNKNKNNYAYLASPYHKDLECHYAKECIDNSNASCMLTYGRSGHCVENGKCCESFLVDRYQDSRDVPKPYCVPPIFKEDCGYACECWAAEAAMSGKQMDKKNCYNQCISSFAP